MILVNPEWEVSRKATAIQRGVFILRYASISGREEMCDIWQCCQTGALDCWQVHLKGADNGLESLQKAIRLDDFIFREIRLECLAMDTQINIIASLILQIVEVLMESWQSGRMRRS